MHTATVTTNADVGLPLAPVAIPPLRSRIHRGSANRLVVPDHDPLPPPDLGGIALPTYQRGLQRYTIDQWERLARSGMPYGASGDELLGDACRRLRATQAAIATTDLVPDTGLERRYRGILSEILTYEGGNHLETWMLQVFDQVPRERTRDNAVFAITRSWLPFRAAWDCYMAAISDPAVFRDPQVLCDRCVDLPRGPAFVDHLLREQHRLDLHRLSGYTPIALRDERCIATWRSRLEQFVADSDAQVDAWFERRGTWVAQVTARLAALHDAGRTQRQPAAVLRELLAPCTGTDGSPLRVSRDRYGTWELIAAGAGRFAGHGATGLICDIAADPFYDHRMPRDLGPAEIIPWLRQHAPQVVPAQLRA